MVDFEKVEEKGTRERKFNVDWVCVDVGVTTTLHPTCQERVISRKSRFLLPLLVLCGSRRLTSRWHAHGVHSQLASRPIDIVSSDIRSLD